MGVVDECFCWLNTWADDVLGGAAALLALSAGLLVLAVGPTRKANRRLAAVLIGEALFVGAALFLWPMNFLMMAILAGLYLALLGLLDTPLVRWIRGHENGLVLACASLFVSTAAAGLVVFFFAPPQNMNITPLPLMIGLFAIAMAYGLASVFGLVASIDALRRSAPGTTQRNRASSFTTAFAIRDLTVLLLLTGSMLMSAGEGDVQTQQPGFLGWLGWNWFTIMPALGLLLYVPVLSYGILKSQIFDIDLKIKRGMRATLLSSLFVAVFFIISEAAQQFFSERVGTYFGIGAAGALVLAIVPLQRVAERIMNHAMPGVRDDSAYLQYRRMTVYRTAVEGAFEDGQVNDKERRMLTRLAAELLLQPSDMTAIEREVMEAQEARLAISRSAAGHIAVASGTGTSDRRTLADASEEPAMTP